MNDGCFYHQYRDIILGLWLDNDSWYLSINVRPPFSSLREFRAISRQDCRLERKDVVQADNEAFHCGLVVREWQSSSVFFSSKQLRLLGSRERASYSVKVDYGLQSNVGASG